MSGTSRQYSRRIRTLRSITHKRGAYGNKAVCPALISAARADCPIQTLSSRLYNVVFNV